MPRLLLPATSGDPIDIGALSGWTVIYCYPMTGRPDRALSDRWDAIPGARGCTPQACAFRDAYARLQDLRASVYGVSAQTTGYQREAAERLHLPFPLLSDVEGRFVAALKLPTLSVDGMRLIKRLTLIVRDGTIKHVFYPVFPPDRNPEEVIDWLRRYG